MCKRGDFYHPSLGGTREQGGHINGMDSLRCQKFELPYSAEHYRLWCWVQANGIPLHSEIIDWFPHITSELSTPRVKIL